MHKYHKSRYRARKKFYEKEENKECILIQKTIKYSLINNFYCMNEKRKRCETCECYDCDCEECNCDCHEEEEVQGVPV